MSAEAFAPPPAAIAVEEKQPAAPTPIMPASSRSSSTATATAAVRDLSPEKPALSADPPSPAPVFVDVPPNGGLTAWLQVLCGHLAVFNSWGYINSFGLFQGTYQTLLHEPGSTVSWIGSLQVFLIFFIGAFTGRAMDAGYFRPVLFAGTVLQLVGVFMTSLAQHAYWQIFLAQGLCQGLGAGLFFGPVIALVATYFSSRRTLAMTLAASGSGTGGVVFPVIAQRLLPRLGFAWTVRVMGFVMLANSIFILAFTRTRLPPRKSGPLIELSAFRELPYLLYCIGMFFTLWGTYFAYYYASVYAVDVLGASQTTSFNILLVLNGVGVPGRIIPGLLADRFSPRSPIFVIVPTIFVASICLYVWIATKSIAGYYIWTVFFGWFGGSIQGLFPATIPSLGSEPSKNGTRVGMAFSIVSIACLTGPPLAGKLIQTANGSYVGAGTWGGTSLMIGSAFAAAAAYCLRKRDKRLAAEKLGNKV